MKSTPVQFCKIIQYCMEQYSKSTNLKVANLLNTHERVFLMEKIIQDRPNEEVFLERIEKELNTL